MNYAKFIILYSLFMKTNFCPQNFIFDLAVFYAILSLPFFFVF